LYPNDKEVLQSTTSDGIVQVAKLKLPITEGCKQAVRVVIRTKAARIKKHYTHARRIWFR